MNVKLLTEHHLEFLSIKGDYRGSSESTQKVMSKCHIVGNLMHWLKSKWTCVWTSHLYGISRHQYILSAATCEKVLPAACIINSLCCMLGFLQSADFFFKINLFRTSFKNTISTSVQQFGFRTDWTCCRSKLFAKMSLIVSLRIILYINNNFRSCW